MLQMLKFLGREIRFHVWSISLQGVSVVLVCGTLPTVPVLLWKNESVGTLPMLNPVISSATVFWTPALVAAPYVSHNGSEAGKGEENCHCAASVLRPCLSTKKTRSFLLTFTLVLYFR